MKWLFLAYAVILTVIFIYIHSLHRRQTALERDLDLLRATSGERSKK